MEKQLISLLPHLKRFAMSLTSNRDDALDLVQDTCLKAIRFKDKFDGRNLKAWLFTLCKNSFINDYRKEKLENELIDSTPDLYYLNLTNDKGDISPESSLQAKELQQFIDQVPDENRICLQLHINGYKYHEIAEKLGVKIGTIKSRIFFARKKIMEDIKNENLKPVKTIIMKKELTSDQIKEIMRFRETYSRLMNDKQFNKSRIIRETGLFWTTLTPLLIKEMPELNRTQPGTFVKIKSFSDKYALPIKIEGTIKGEDIAKALTSEDQETIKCPFGFNFGIDFDNFASCNECDKWVACTSWKRNNKKPNEKKPDEEIFWNAINTAQRNCPKNVTLTIVINK